ncbi:MAG: universal stress protein [Cyanothece sp. SIO1E1]|nr:universal stress protein [Cyanothece sp. SIO1E1]
MFHKILVALDNSAIGKYVFDEALCLAQAIRASLMLIHVLSPDEAGYPDTHFLSSSDYAPVMATDQAIKSYLDQLEACKAEGLQLLQSHANTARSKGIKTEFTQTLGSPGHSICDLAQTWGADLIMTGRRNRSVMGQLFLGSVSNYVSHNAPCSVLTVHTT